MWQWLHHFCSPVAFDLVLITTYWSWNSEVCHFIKRGSKRGILWRGHGCVLSQWKPGVDRVARTRRFRWLQEEDEWRSCQFLRDLLQNADKNAGDPGCLMLLDRGIGYIFFPQHWATKPLSHSQEGLSLQPPLACFVWQSVGMFRMRFLPWRVGEILIF